MQKRFFDLHTDTASAMCDRRRHLAANDLHVDLLRAGRDFTYVAFMTLFSDAAHTDMTGRYEELLAYRARETAGKCRFVTSRRTYDEAVKQGLYPMLHAVEGAEMLSCAPEKLRAAVQNDGLVMSGIAWNNPNALYREEGLTDRGRAYIDACNALKVVIDISHLRDMPAAEALERGERVIASHSDARALCGVPRNLPDSLIRLIGEKKGLIGLNFHAPFIGGDPSEQTLARLARHASHIASIAGTEVLALGSDFDGCSLPGGIRGVEDLPLFAEELEKAGFSAEEVDNICFMNAFRYFLA